jgi:hypothetical protein
MTAFWDVALFSLVEMTSIVTMLTETVRNSEKWVYFIETTRRYLPGSCHLHTLCCNGGDRDHCCLWKTLWSPTAVTHGSYINNQTKIKLTWKYICSYLHPNNELHQNPLSRVGNETDSWTDRALRSTHSFHAIQNKEHNFRPFSKNRFMFIKLLQV